MISDESALRALSLEYAAAVRSRDAERWGLTWDVNARWVLGPDRDVVGREAIVDLWRTAIAKYAHVVQLYMSATFDIEGDHATGQCQFLELNRTAEGGSHMLAGHYDDTYVRTTDGWRFASRELTRYYAGTPDLLGEFVPS